MSTLISDRKSRIKQLACASFEVAPDQMNEIEIEPESIRRMTSVGAVYELVAEVAGWPVDENAASR